MSVSTALLTLATAFGLSVWQFGEPKSLVEGALRSDDLALSLDFIFYTAAAAALVLSLRERPHLPTSLADYSALLLASVTGMVVLAGATNLVTLFLGNRAALDPAVRDVRARPAPAHVAGGGPQVPGDRVGRLRDAAVRARLHLRRERLDRLRPDRGLDLRVRASPATRCC